MMKQFNFLIAHFFVFLPFIGTSQILQSTSFIKGGVDDAEKIIQAYVLPVEKGIGIVEAQSKLHLYKKETGNKFTIGFGLNVSSSFVPQKDKTYNVNDLALENFQASDGNLTTAQTIAGNTQTIWIETKQTYTSTTTSFPFVEEKPILKLTSPEGVDLSIVPYARMHLFIEKNGNFLNLKMLPSIKLFGNKMNVFAIGGDVQVNLASVFKKFKNAPLEIYLSTGYNHNRIQYFLDIQPDENSLTFTNPINVKSYENQIFQMNSTTIPVQLEIVKPLGNFSVVLSSGYNLIYSNVRLIGNYPVYRTDPSNTFNIIVDNFIDPISYRRNFNQFFVGFGTTYRIKHFNVSLNYNLSSYQNVNLLFSYLF